MSKPPVEASACTLGALYYLPAHGCPCRYDGPTGERWARPRPSEVRDAGPFLGFTCTETGRRFVVHPSTTVAYPR